MKQIYRYKGRIAAECSSISFEARVAEPGMLRHIVPHAQLNVDVDICVHGAHAYHTVYISNCPSFNSFVFSHDIAAWSTTQKPENGHQAIVTTDVMMHVPWVLQSLGQSIVNGLIVMMHVPWVLQSLGQSIVNGLIQFLFTLL